MIVSPLPVNINNDEVCLMWSQAFLLVDDKEKALFLEELSLLENQYNDEISAINREDKSFILG